MKTRYPEVETPACCMICGTTIMGDSLHCRECFAPIALTQDGPARGREPQIVSILGESNVGKTVYLGFLLDMLSQQAGDFEAIPVGAYSVNVQQNVITHMANRVFPPKTPMEADQWHWAYYQINRRSAAESRWVDLVMPDMAGESLAAEVETPQTFRVINGLIHKSVGLLLLLDAALAANGSSQPDFFGLKILSYIDAVHGSGRDRRVETPTAVVLCKADHCPECFDDPRQFARANLNRVWNMCQNRFANVAFFASSVVGSLGYAMSPQEDYAIPVPLHTALRGVLEPFEWTIDQL